jgi:mannosidase alpha-like ER degradation enhancer 3
VVRRRLTAADFQSTNEAHMKLVRNMGITIVTLPDGRVQLLHTHRNARSPEDGEEGLLFMQVCQPLLLLLPLVLLLPLSMQEMIDLSKQQTSQPESPPKLVTFTAPGLAEQGLQAGPAQFGTDLTDGRKVGPFWI